MQESQTSSVNRALQALLISVLLILSSVAQADIKVRTGGFADESSGDRFYQDLMAGASPTTTDNVLAYTYTYDTIGNLKTRQNTHYTARSQEAFCYDGLNRLTHHVTGLDGNCVGGSGVKFWSYDGHGNIASTTDATNNLHLYNYAVSVAADPAQPCGRSLHHAVGTFQNFDWGNGNISSATFTYDRNGNMVNDANRYLEYAAFNLPTVMCIANAGANGCLTGNNSRKASFAYDAEHQRIWQKNQTTNASGVTTLSQTVYLNPGNGAGLSYEKECQPDCDSGTSTTRTRHRHYLNIAGMSIGVHIVDSQIGGTGTQYWHKDHLGSVAAVTNDASPNAPCEHAAYDAYGQRNGIQSGASEGNCSPAGVQPTERGFTENQRFHENQRFPRIKGSRIKGSQNQRFQVRFAESKVPGSI